MSEEMKSVRRYGLSVFDWNQSKVYRLKKKNPRDEYSSESADEISVEDLGEKVSLSLNGRSWKVENTSPMGLLPLASLRDNEEYHRLLLESLSYSGEIARLNEANSLVHAKMAVITDEESRKVPDGIPLWLSTVSYDGTYEKRRDFFWARGLDPCGFYQATMQQALYIQDRAELEQVVNGIREIEPYLLPVLEGLKLIAYSPYHRCVKYVCTKDGKSWSVVDEDLKQEEYAPENGDLSEAVKFALRELKSKEY